jgi:hypothetical protein
MRPTFINEFQMVKDVTQRSLDLFLKRFAQFSHTRGVTFTVVQ